MLKTEWRPTQDWIIRITYARFFVGKFIRESGLGDDVDYTSATVR